MRITILNALPLPAVLCAAVLAGTVCPESAAQTAAGQAAPAPDDDAVTAAVERRLASQVAGSVAGVRELVNELSVEYDTTRTDADIRHDVEGRLAADARVNGGDVEVEVEDGVVTLTGTVSSAAARERALHLAGVAGVERVEILDLRVDTSGMKRHAEPRPAWSDDRITRAVEDALVRDPRVAAFDVSATVEDGVVNRKVWLMGEVESRMARFEAGQIAAATPGVVAVSNQLVSLQLASGFVTPDDRELELRIREDLWWNPYVDQERAEVQVVAGVVTLTGEVLSWFQRTVAQNVALEAGADTVINNLSVVVDATER